MENNIAQKITAFATILALPFALGAFVLTWAPAQQFYLSDPTYDGFVQPRSIAKLVEITQDSTVTVYCDYGVEKYTQGTAFAVELEHSQGEKYKTTLLTNHHVIEKCLDNNKKIYVFDIILFHFFSAFPVYSAFKEKPLTETTLNLTPGISPLACPFLPNPATITFFIPLNYLIIIIQEVQTAVSWHKTGNLFLVLLE